MDDVVPYLRARQAVFWLVVVAIGLCSQRRATARRTAIAAMLLALAVTFVLVMQLLDANETMQDRSVQLAGLLVYLAAIAVELPAFTDRWPPDRSRPRTPPRHATRGLGS